ncbi:MAG: dihydroneopterin aldolase [Deltaproteobacteria bacterium]|nr:dihydroneopterin aldolase [Deltaproteobacteria bacterium]
MIGTIGLKNLHIECIVGIYPHERTDEQPLFVDIEVDHDFDRAAAAEHVDETVDYDHLAALLTKLATEQRYQLIETFAKDAIDQIMARWSDVLGVRIEVRKPNAVPAAAASFVRLAAQR